MLLCRPRHIPPLFSGQRSETLFNQIELILQLASHVAITLAGLLLQLYLQLLPAAFVGAALLVWSCAGMLFSPSDFKWRSMWPLVLAPSLASVVLANLAPAMGARPIMHHSVEVTLAVLYFTLRYMYQTYRLSSAKSRLS